MVDEPRRTFLFVVGATATGKSDLAIKLAKGLGWPIINFDSLQVYQRLNIGSAKPSREERGAIPHFLFDFVPPPQICTAASYLNALEPIANDPRWPGLIFVGGSGFYLQAIEKGLLPDATTSPQLKQEVSEWFSKSGPQALHNWLRSRDPQAAEKINLNDHYRLLRAVEILKGTSGSLAELRQKLRDGGGSFSLPPHRPVKIGLRGERESLRKRVEQRTQKMLDQGWLQEVEGLIKDGLQSWSPLTSVGYREVMDFLLKGESDQDRLREQIVNRTMQLCKKQRTWFQRDTDIHWFDFSDTGLAFDKALTWCTSEKS